MAQSSASVLTKIQVLLWKNLILRKRHYLMTIIEVILPSLFIGILLFAYWRPQVQKSLETRGSQGSGARLSFINPIEDAYEKSLVGQFLTESKNWAMSGIVAYTPGNGKFSSLVINALDDWLKNSNSSIRLNFKAFESENEIEKLVQKQLSKKFKLLPWSPGEIEVAIIFDSGFGIDPADPTALPIDHKFAYKLRFTNQFKTNEIFPDSRSEAEQYKSSGFLGLQILIDKMIIEKLTSTTVNTDYLWEEALPGRNKDLLRASRPNGNPGDHPISDIFYESLKIILIVSIVLIPAVLVEVVGERETGMKELLRMMGLPNRYHILCWLINFGISSVICATLVIIVLIIPVLPTTKADDYVGIMQFGNPVLFWIAIFLYYMQTVTFMLLLAALFERAVFPIGVALLFCIFSVVYVLVQGKLGLVWLNLPFCFFPDVAFIFISNTFYGSEREGEGIRFNNLFQRTERKPIPVGLIMCLMGCYSLLHVLLALYFENILPFSFGVRRPWYFIFQRKKKKPALRKSSTVSVEPLPTETQEGSSDDNYFEAEPTSNEAGVRIQRMRKVFTGGKVAVDNVSLNIYRGQITVLLGHNGAGKTTLMAMLTGLTSPTSGSATINGYSVTTQITEARQSLGICPQHNMFYSNLTLNEHLVFFAKLKGIKSQQVQGEIDRLLYRLELSDKKHKLSSTLSGGQKRKQNLLMALIGGSETVILDEPTSGMDPEARRLIWDVLSEMREGRTILLTTHIMEEADFLGDRIAIMSEGKLKCCGSPMFLKRCFGTGYTLHIRLSTPEQSVKQGLLQAIQSHFQHAYFQPSNSINEVVIALPSVHLQDSDGSNLPALFFDIEKRKAELQIIALHLSFTTMDDIFISVATMDELEVPIAAAVKASPVAEGEESTLDESNRKSSAANKKGTLSIPTENSGSESNVPPQIDVVESGVGSAESVMTPGLDLSAQASIVPLHSPKNTGISLFFQQLFGLIVKRLLYTIRKKTLLLLLFIMPIGMFILGLRLMNDDVQNPAGSKRSLSPEAALPSLLIDLSSYHQPDAVVSYSSESDAPSQDLAKAYKTVALRSASTANVRTVTGDIRVELQSLAESSNETYPYAYIVAAEFKPGKNRALYSPFAHHAAPLSLNMMHNALLLNLLPTKRARIQVSNHPLFLASASAAVQKLVESHMSFLIGRWFALTVAVGLIICPAVFVLGPIEERIIQVKQLQLMTGLPAITYWAGFFIVDLLLMMLMAIVFLVCLPIFQVYGCYTSYNGPWVLLLILLSYSFASISQAYLVSLLFKTGAVGFSFVIVPNVIVGIIASSILGMLLPANVDIMFHVLPFFGLAKTLQTFGFIAAANNRCAQVTAADKALVCSSSSVNPFYKACCDDVIASCHTPIEPYCDQVQLCFRVAPYIKWSFEGLLCPRKTGMGQDLFWQFLVGILYFAILLCVDMGLFRKLKMLVLKVGPGSARPGQADSDVVDETVRTEQLVNPGPFDDAIALIHIRKTFGGLTAVADVTFGVHPGECFGLLGVNGAGKTTCFSVITGDILPSAGNGYMSSRCSLIHERSEFLGRIGYCPQGNAILGCLTGKEILALFSRLRGGLKPKESAFLWLSKFGLEESGNVRCENYSGGMKRRLCTAIAMIEDPPIVLLDEPTSGVDPVARRQFWAILQAVQQGGQSVILTSHSMDECEALCSRLGIMVKGQLQCMGDIGHIKDKFGAGFIYTIKIKPLPTPSSANPSEVSVIDNKFRIDWLIKEILVRFSPCEIVDRHQNVVQYRVYNVSLTWGQRFEIAEELKKRFSNVIEDYTLNETSLEEVFLSFARPQIQNPYQLPVPRQVQSQVASPAESNTLQS